MGDIWSQDHLVLFLAFFIPGFIASQIYALYVGVDDSDPVKRLPAVVGYSAIHYALTGWLILVVPEGRARAIVAYIVVFLLPLLWAPIILLIRDWQKWKTIFLWNYLPINIKGGISAMLAPEETPWDATLTPEARYVRIRLKSGTYVGGYFGDGSAVSTYPNDREIYISEAYSFDVDGKIGNPIAGTGVLILGDQIEVLETITRKGA